MKKATKQPETIDAYIRAFPDDVQRLLKAMRQAIKKVVPKETGEKIGYGIPTFTFHGNLVHFGGFKDHVSFFPGSGPIKVFQKELSSYVTSKGTIQFPLDKPLPLKLIENIVRLRVQENMGKGKKKGIKKVCSRGHVFYKSSDCPVCPKCWSGYYRKRTQSDFPEKISAPALRALLNAKITKLSNLAKFTEKEISEFHGMGPKALGQLKVEMKKRKLAFVRQ